VLLKCTMTILPRTGRYILFLSILILISQVAVVTGQNRKSGVTVSYESSGSSESRALQTQIHFQSEWSSHIWHKMRGSGEASGEDAVYCSRQLFPPRMVARGFYHVVRITGVMRSD